MLKSHFEFIFIQPKWLLILKIQFFQKNADFDEIPSKNRKNTMLVVADKKLCDVTVLWAKGATK